MKLTNKHIGRKFTHPMYRGEDYMLFTGYRTERRDATQHTKEINYLRFKIDGTVYDNGQILESGYGPEEDKWEPYEKAKKDWFDFSIFGCNEEHVRDLVKILDKRYQRVK